MVWGDSAAAQRWGGGQDPTPGRGLVRGRMGPAMVLEQSEQDASQRSGGCCGEVAPEQELTAFLHLTSRPQISGLSWNPTCGCPWRTPQDMAAGDGQSLS